MSPVEEPVVLDPHDTTHLRKLLNPVMNKNERHTFLGDNPARAAFLDSLIKEALVHIIPELTAFAERYLAAIDTGPPVTVAPNGGDDGTTPTPPGEPSSPPTRRFNRPEDLAALRESDFLQAIATLPHDELAHLSRIPTEPGEIDVFNATQRTRISEILAGVTKHADEFEIMAPDPTPKPGDVFEHDGRQVRTLSVGDEPGTVRVVHVDPRVRRDVPIDSAQVVGDDGEIIKGVPCKLCDHEPFKSRTALLSHGRAKHPGADVETGQLAE